MIVGIIPPLIIVFVVTFILLLILMNKSFSFVKFYFTIVAIVSIIGMAIAFGVAIYQQGMLLLISDDEYLSGRGYREIKQCEEPTYVPAEPDGTSKTTPKTPAEIEQCKQEEIARVSKQRSYDAKEATIGGITRGVIFLILFAFHYPRMLREQEVTAPSRKPAPRRRVAKK